MSTAKKQQPVIVDRKSEVRQKNGTKKLEIIPDIKHVDSSLIDKARDELLKARNELLKNLKTRDRVSEVIANEKGQLSLFGDMDERISDVTEEGDERIPANMAEEVMKKASSQFTDEQQIGYELDDENDAIKIVARRKKSDPRDEIADYSK